MKVSRRNSGGMDRAAAFTLVELLASMAVFLVLMGVFMLAIQGAQAVWTKGDQKTQIYQSGRAVMELFSRELRNAVVSDRYQFVQTPDLSTLVTITPKVAPNSHSLFWIAPGSAATGATTLPDKSSLAEFGYYLTRDDPTKTYELKRFFFTPNSPSPASVILPQTSYTATANLTGVTTIPWLDPVTNSKAKLPLLFDPAGYAVTGTSDKPAAAVTVASGVVALWIRCFDAAGNAIPWLYQDSRYSAAMTMPTSSTQLPLQFNSAATFEMSSKDGSFTDANGNAVTFQYLAVPTGTPTSSNGTKPLQAHQLPESVEITIITIDAASVARNASGIPKMLARTDSSSLPATSHPAGAPTQDNVPDQIKYFQDTLTKNKLTSAQTFSTRVHLSNGFNSTF